MRVIGSGAFGKVFLAQSQHDESFQVAIKVLDKIKLVDSIDCIQEEIACLQRLDHPNIVRYFETYNDYKYIYLVMEYVQGAVLTNKITSSPNQCFSEAVAAGYMKSLFESIVHCHAQNIMHGDIKTDNVIITADDQVRLLDFGLSKQGQVKCKDVRGSPYYMAPEVIKGCFDKQADIWALGVMLYVMLCGYLPF